MANEKRLISYDVLMKHLDSCIEQGKGLFKSVCVAIKCFVEQMPTVDAVEVVHGRWEDESDEYEKGMDLRCLVCGGRADSFVGGTEDWYCLWKPNFCPHCGARMDGDEDDNDT